MALQSSSISHLLEDAPPRGLICCYGKEVGSGVANDESLSSGRLFRAAVDLDVGALVDTGPPPFDILMSLAGR